MNYTHKTLHPHQHHQCLLLLLLLLLFLLLLLLLHSPAHLLQLVHGHHWLWL
jgi:hypothetical protein